MAKVESEPRWQDILPGLIIDVPGTSQEYKTGDWRSSCPVVDESKCIKCGICYIFCPDMAIVRTEEGYFQADLFFCKGCGICAQECFTGCISMVDEEE